MYYVGIDVSKRSLDVCLLTEGSKSSRKTKTISNGQDSAQSLAKWLILQKCKLSQTHVIMEATSIHHEYLACGLHQMGLLTAEA
jgi:transposase